jgi:hypothetical protein
MSTTKGLIICLLEFKGRRRTSLMQPGKYTELFFLDEPTALAAGHRPCAECRRTAFNRFRDAIATAEGTTEKLLARQMVPSIWWGGHLRRWAQTGYGPPCEVPRVPVPVLTPLTTLAALSEGYRPIVHPSIGTL